MKVKFRLIMYPSVPITDAQGLSLTDIAQVRARVTTCMHEPAADVI